MPLRLHSLSTFHSIFDVHFELSFFVAKVDGSRGLEADSQISRQR